MVIYSLVGNKGFAALAFGYSDLKVDRVIIVASRRKPAKFTVFIHYWYGWVMKLWCMMMIISSAAYVTWYSWIGWHDTHAHAAILVTNSGVTLAVRWKVRLNSTLFALRNVAHHSWKYAEIIIIAANDTDTMFKTYIDLVAPNIWKYLDRACMITWKNGKSLV